MHNVLARRSSYVLVTDGTGPNEGGYLNARDNTSFELIVRLNVTIFR